MWVSEERGYWITTWRGHPHDPLVPGRCPPTSWRLDPIPARGLQEGPSAAEGRRGGLLASGRLRSWVRGGGSGPEPGLGSPTLERPLFPLTARPCQQQMAGAQVQAAAGGSDPGLSVPSVRGQPVRGPALLWAPRPHPAGCWPPSGGRTVPFPTLSLPRRLTCLGPCLRHSGPFRKHCAIGVTSAWREEDGDLRARGAPVLGGQMAPG